MKRAHKKNVDDSDSSSSSSSDSSSSSTESDDTKHQTQQQQRKPTRRRAPPKKKQATLNQERMRKIFDELLIEEKNAREQQQQRRIQQQMQASPIAVDATQHSSETFVSRSSAADESKATATSNDSTQQQAAAVTTFMDVVDDNIVKYIISNGHDTLHHLMQLRLVCKKWRACAQSEEVWGMYRNEILSMLPKPMRLKHEKQLMGSINDPPMKTYAIYLYNRMDDSKKLLTSRVSTLKRLQEQTQFPSIPIDYVEKRIEYFVELKKEHALKRRQLLFHKRFKIGYADCLAPVANADKKQQQTGKPRRRLPLYIGGQLYFVQGDDVDDVCYEDSLQQVGDDAVPTLVFEEHFTTNGKSRVVAKASSVVGNITCGHQGKKKKPLSFV